MRKITLYLAIAATSVLSGCGDVMERPCTHQLTIHGARPHQSLTATIRPVPVVPSHPEQRLVANSHGEATARFVSSWYATAFSFPRLGIIPREASKPEYLVVTGQHQFVLSPATPDIQYRWQDGGWITDASLRP